MASYKEPPAAIVAGSDLIWQNQFRQTLPECGLRPLIVRTGPEAVDLAQLVSAQLVILDVRATLREGLHACSDIRRIPAYRLTPIIMLISGADPVTLEAGRQAGASRFVTLPISILAMKQEILPLVGATAPKPAAYAEWKPRAEPPPAFGEQRAFVDGRTLLDVYRRAGTSRILRHVTVHR
ncbi:MAG TPA: response regulator [Acetobacteraceae bacterium]|nr:response regulator [Acetobacteraceae bacterium]